MNTRWVRTCLLAALCTLGVGCAPSSSQSTASGRHHPLPFRAQGDYLAAYDAATDAYTPFFMKGMNLGVGVPGTQPG